MRLFLFVVVLALAVLGALAVPPPALPPGADGWHYCTKATGGTGSCHVGSGTWKNGVEYLVMMKAIDNSKLAFTRIASGNSSLCKEDWFGGRPTSVTHDCYFTEVDGSFIKSPVSAKGWGGVRYAMHEMVSLGAGVWAIKYQNKYDVRNYVVGLSGADVAVNHACSDHIVGMTFKTSLAEDYSTVSPISGPSRADGLCFVSVEPVIAAKDMGFFSECGRINNICELPFTGQTEKGVILRIGSHRTHNWQYKQIFGYKAGELFPCKSAFFRASDAGAEVCEFFNPPISYSPTFHSNVAGWELEDSFEGRPGEIFSISYTAEVTSTRGTDLSEEWGSAITMSVEASVEYGGAGGSVGLSVEQSKTISQGVTSEVSRGTAVTRTFACEIQPGESHVSGWVWRITGTEESAAQTLPDSPYDIHSTQTACTGTSHAPCCPPGWQSNRTDIDCRIDLSFVVEHDCERKM